MQQMGRLIPRYSDNLQWVDEGSESLEHVKVVWGVLADVIGSATGLPPTLETLVALGFERAADVREIVAVEDTLSLVASPAASVDFDTAAVSEMRELLVRAIRVDREAKPVLATVRNAVALFDTTSAQPLPDGPVSESFSDLLDSSDEIRHDFPSWDDRPLFLDEQKAFLFYCGLNAAAEVVVELLPDRSLGRRLLLNGGILRPSGTGELVLNSALVPMSLLAKPVEVICHEVGDAILEALAPLEDSVELIDLISVAEVAVRDRCGIDLSMALDDLREHVIIDTLSDLYTDMLDLTTPPVDSN
jgi:hypothetical protein